MVKYFFLIFLMLSCAHEKPDSTDRGKEILTKMSVPEKYKILRAYRFLQTLSANSPGRMPIAHGYLPGIPRLGIPSIEFVGNDTNSRQIARDEKILKLGFVNLIRDSEKTQVFGNFEEAGKVDSILSPEKEDDFRKIARDGELKDLDLFLVQSGSPVRVRNYVCAQYRDKDDFKCVSARLENMLREMGLSDDYDQKLAEESLNGQDLDRIVMEVLSTMDELKII
ncbi:MAG: hypothetical protein V4598_04240 [Bdellovibrionota bacterium]